MVQSFRIHGLLSCLQAVAVAAATFDHFGFVASTLIGWLFGGLACLALFVAWRARSTPDRYKVLADAVAVLGLLVFFPVLFGFGLLPALLSLMLCTQSALNFVFREYRHFYLSLAVTFTALCVGAAASRQGGYLVYCLLYVVFAVLCLGCAHIERQSANNHTPQQNALVWRRRDRLRLIAVLLMMATAIYLLLPRLPAGNVGTRFGAGDHFYQSERWQDELDRPESQPPTDSAGLDSDGRQSAGSAGQGERIPGEYDYSGFDDEFDIREPDPEQQRFRNGLVARMRADHGAYLRAQIFDTFDGVKWHKSSRKDRKIELRQGRANLVTRHVREPFQQQIFVKIPLGDYILASAVPVGIVFPGNVIAKDDFGQLRSPQALRSGTVFSVDSELTWHQGRLFSERDLPASVNYRQLPAGLDSRIGLLAARIASQSANQIDAALQLEQHLRTEYRYSFESIFESQNETPLAKFLFEDKAGHCEYFASALAIMLRTLDIPSRLVTGFSATTQNPLTGYYEIHALDGHAWVEAYVDGLGWMVLEPTAFYSPPEQQQSRLSAEQIDDYVERLSQLSEQLSDGRAPGLTEIAVGLWQAAATLFTVLLAYLKLFFFRSWLLFLSLLAAGVLGYFFWIRYQRALLDYFDLRRVKAYSGAGASEAVDFYLHRIDRMMNRYRRGRGSGTTIETYLRSLDDLGLSGDECGGAEHIVNEANYAGATAITLDPRGLRTLFFKLYEANKKY